MKTTFGLCAVAALFLVAVTAHAQQTAGLKLVTKEKLLGSVPEGAVLSLQLVSPDSSRFVYVVRRDDKWYVAVNGKLGAAYNAVAPRTMRFSPDGKRFVYAARLGADWFLVRDSKAQKLIGEPAAPAFAPNPLFSPDSHRLALVLKQGDMFSLVMDGVEVGRYASVNGLTFSPDSRHWAFSTGHDDKSQIITDSGPGPEYKTVSLPLFSADNHHLGYVASRGAGEFTVIDGAESKVYEAVNGLTFSPDGRRIGFQAKTKEHLIMFVVDGKEHKGYTGGISSPLIFSPDSRHVAYVASDGNNAIPVLDEVEQKAYPGIYFMTFSPDSQHLLLQTKSGAQDVVVVDGKEGKPYPLILRETITFSPTGRLAYRVTITEQRPVEDDPGTTAEVDKEAFIIADGVEGTRFPAVDYPSFSADGTYLAYKAARDTSWRLYVNGVEGDKTYDAFMGSHRSEFVSKDRLRLIGIRQAQVFRVEVRIKTK